MGELYVRQKMKITLIAAIIAASSLIGVAADAVPFTEAKPERDIDYRVSLRLKVGEKLYIKLTKGFLVLSIEDIQFQEGDDERSESCVITTTHIENDRVTSEAKKSFIVYSAEKRDDGGKHLTVVDGSQDFRKAGIKLSWSYASEDSIYFYVPPKTFYAITAVEE